jgi:hypothetical protein
MRTINRWALVVRFKEPYLRWAAGLDEKAPDDAASMKTAISVYLIPEDPNRDEDNPPLEEYYGQIFTQELEAWWTDEARWPAKRDLATFQEWFEVTAESIVTDLGTGPIRIEKL